MKTLNVTLTALAAFALISSASAQNPTAQGYGMSHFYIGVDKLPTFASGTYAGQANPNFNRLSFLYSHAYEGAAIPTSHFHSIGVHTLTGPAGSPTVLDTSNGNRIPEVYQQTAGMPPIGLSLSGNSYVPNGANHEYESIRFQPTGSLLGYGATDLPTYVVNSGGTGQGQGGRRWTNPIAGAEVGLELVSRTPGLKIGTAAGQDLFANTNIINIGDGATLDWSPIFSVDYASAMSGDYQATFRLVDFNDAGTNYGDGGRFGFDFRLQAVPEPSTYALMGMGILGAFSLRFRRRK